MMRILLSMTACVVCSAVPAAALEVAPLFTDHMVLQQKAPVPVWGKAAPGDSVTVSVANRTAKTIAGPDGQWKVSLKPLPAGGPYTMTIASSSQTLEFKDVLVGEVWVCSGQSNMEWSVNQVNNADQEVAAANHPRIRLFTVLKRVSEVPIDTCDGMWSVCTPESIPFFSAVGYFFGRTLQENLDVPVGLIDSSWGGSSCQAWTSAKTLETDPEFNAYDVRRRKMLEDFPVTAAQEESLAAWREKAIELLKKGEGETWPPAMPAGPRNFALPSGLYNGMIHPLAPYGIRGAIWYQGESNAGEPMLYRKLFPSMIADWRALWGQGDFPFYFVQLANFMDRTEQPQPVSYWALLREAQTMTLSVKNTGMAVAIDIGEAKDIHPRNKQDVGRRLALAALAKTYRQDIPYSGPMFKKMTVRGREAVISFTHTDGGLVAKNGTLKGFAMAGEDQRLVWANATIRGKNVVLTADGVEKPVAVRYAWGDNPEATLYNGAGLPAVPFRTDTAVFELVAPKRFPAPPNATVIDISARSAEWTLGWEMDANAGSYSGVGFWAKAGDGRDTLRWKLAGVKPGRYEISVWISDNPNNDHASNARYTVHHTAGETVVEVDQTKNNRTWRALGTFAIDASSFLELSNLADANVVADSIALVPVK